MMNVVRNILMVVVVGGAAISGGLFGLLTVPAGSQDSGSTPPTPAAAPFAGAQLAFGSTNNATGPTGTITPTTPSVVLGGVQNFQTNLPSNYIDNYALLSAALLQSFIDHQRAHAGVPTLAYDPNLGAVAAALIADTITSGQPFPQQGGLNSLNQTPIQQVLAMFPTSTATYVSAFIVITDVDNSSNALVPRQGLITAETDLLTDPNAIMFNAGWTHYGLAVETTPAVAGQSNARQYYVIFFAKEQ
jgi:hypothetical protein